jgi:hypothetical protein
MAGKWNSSWRVNEAATYKWLQHLKRAKFCAHAAHRAALQRLGLRQSPGRFPLCRPYSKAPEDWAQSKSSRGAARDLSSLRAPATLDVTRAATAASRLAK